MILIAIWDLEHKQIYQRLIKLHEPVGGGVGEDFAHVFRV